MTSQHTPTGRITAGHGDSAKATGPARRPRRRTSAVATLTRDHTMAPPWQHWQPRLEAALGVTRRLIRDYRVGTGRSQDIAAQAFVEMIPPDGYGWGMRGSSISRLERQGRDLGSFNLRGFITLLRTYRIKPTRWARELEDAMAAQGQPFLDDEEPGQPTLELLLVQAFRSLPAEYQPLAVSAVQAITSTVAQRAALGMAPAQTPQVALAQATREVDDWYDHVVQVATTPGTRLVAQ